MKTQHSLLIILFSLLVTSPAIASDWVAVASDPNSKLVMYVDKQSIKGDTINRKFWQKTVFRKEQTDYFGTYYSRKDYLETNCNNNTFKFYESNFYSIDGEIVKHESDSQPHSIRAIPDSVGDVIVKYICSFKQAK